MVTNESMVMNAEGINMYRARMGQLMPTNLKILNLSSIGLPGRPNSSYIMYIQVEKKKIITLSSLRWLGCSPCTFSASLNIAHVHAP